MTPYFSKSAAFAGSASAASADGVSGALGSPRRAASSGHSDSYPLPLKITRLCAFSDSESIFCRALWKAAVCSPGLALPATCAFSSSFAMRSTDSATIVFSTVIGPEQQRLDPGARNSNLLPVNAKGEVRLRSVASFGMTGRVSTPIFIAAAPFDLPPCPLTSLSSTFSSWSPT